MTTYAMNLYDAAPQHKKRMRLVAVEKTLDFNLGPRNATWNNREAWAVSDVIEAIGVRQNQILVGATVEVVKPTSTAANSGHRVSVQDPDGNALAYFQTGLEATTGKIVENYDLFFQPVQYSSSDTIDVKISHAFTTGIIKLVAYLLEEDRS